jgi:hypothetical protein
LSVLQRSLLAVADLGGMLHAFAGPDPWIRLRSALPPSSAWSATTQPLPRSHATRLPSGRPTPTTTIYSPSPSAAARFSSQATNSSSTAART